MTAIELEYIALAYVFPAAWAVTSILCALALIGWRKERQKGAELCAIINSLIELEYITLSKFAKFNADLREECEGLKRDLGKLADKWEGK